jgi:hypothetical protein
MSDREDQERTEGSAVLALAMEPNDSGAETIGGYLIALLHELWRDREDFSGKRPFGNSGWPGELERTLIRAGLVSGTLDEWGGIDDVDSKAAFALIDAAIEALAGEVPHGE